MPFVLLLWARLVQGKPGCAPQTMALFFQVPEERSECSRSSVASGKERKAARRMKEKKEMVYFGEFGSTGGKNQKVGRNPTGKM